MSVPGHRATCIDSTGSPSGGFALAAVLLILVALTLLASGGFLLTHGEYRTSQYHAAGLYAFQTADAAMQDHLGTNRRGTNTVAYSYGSGTATVSGGQLLDLEDGNTLHHVVSRATHLPPGGGQSHRNLGVVAMMHDNSFRANAAFTAGSGLHKNGGAGTLDGFDAASPSDCSAGPQPSVAGVATYPGGYQQNGGSPVPNGAPPIDQSQSGVAQLQDLHLDWAGIVSGNVVAPDFTIPGDAWPDFGSMDPDWWPVIYIDQASYSLSPPKSGRGTIIARYDVVLNGSFSWDGILLVGGTLTSNGNQTIEGTAVTGLNLLLGQSVSASSLGNGNKTFEFHSCWVRYAAQQFVGGLVEIPGTWTERM